MDARGDCRGQLHNGQSYIVSVTRITLIMAEQYLKEQIVKVTGHLKDSITDTNSFEHKRVFDPYTAQTQVNAYHKNKQDDRISDKQIKELSIGANIIDGEQDNDIGYKALKTEIMKSSLRCSSSEIRTRSGHISCKVERLSVMHGSGYLFMPFYLSLSRSIVSHIYLFIIYIECTLIHNACLWVPL